MTISKKVRQQVIDRDGCCPCCGDVYMLTIHHRINRGMGGSRKRDNLANLMVLCSQTNQALESDPVWQRRAIEYGWKLRPWDDPTFIPVYEPMWGNWWWLDDEGGRDLVPWTDHPF
jgi:hypothetical protein